MKTKEALDAALHALLERTFGANTLYQRMNIGSSPTGSRYMIDAIVHNGTERIAVVKKWQLKSGSAQMKMPWEAICLAFAVARSPLVDRGLLILGGSGYTQARYFAERLTTHLILDAPVEVHVLEDAHLRGKF